MVSDVRRGHGVLDADGMALDGAATSYHSFNAIRWLTQTDPAPGGDEVARIAAGRWGPLQWDSLYLDANPGKEIRTSEIVSKASSRRSSGAGSNEIRAYVGLTATPSPQAAAIFGAMIDPGQGSAWVDCYASGSDSYVRIRTNDQERMRIDHSGNVAVNSGLLHVTGHGTPTSGVGLEIEYDGTQGDIMCYNRDSSNYMPLRLRASRQQFIVGTTKALEIETNGNAWFVGDVSAASFTDRTPYPDKATALAAVRSMRQAKRPTGGLDHEALHEYVRSNGNEPGRNLSATVSAQNVVIQELLDRIERLEKGVRA